MGIKKDYESLIATDRESFRHQANEALRKFTPEDRELAASLETEHVLASDLLKHWFEQLEPMYRELDAQLADKKFLTSLKKRFGFTQTAAEDAAAGLVADRKNQLLDEVLDNVYRRDLDVTEYQRAYAEELLMQKPSEIERFADAYGEFITALDAAQRHNVALFDPHGNWLERQRAAMAINRERRSEVEDETTRLEEIDAQLSRLMDDPDSLTAYILSHDWDYARVLDLYEKYRKKVAALPEADHKSPAKRLRLFERVTADFREHEAERLAVATDAHSLADMKKASEQVDARLLEIFDLPARQRQALLQDIERYARLSQERDLIGLVQANRRRFLSTT